MKYWYSLVVIIAFIFGLFLLIPSCKHEISITGQYDTVCFDTKIQPLIAAKCGRCHGGNGSGRSVHPALMTYDEIRKEVTPFNSAQSRLYLAMLSLWENPMPPDSSLSLAERLVIRVWIDQGALHTICPVDTHTYHPPVVPPDTGKLWVNPYACYTRDILPIFSSKCSMTGCHDAISKKSGLDMSGYAAMMAYINDGSAGIVPYNPNASYIYQAIRPGSGEDPMPPQGKTQLTTAELDTISSWISRGAKDTICGETCDTTNVTFSGKVWPIIQNACTGCHSGTSPSSGISLTSFAEVNAIVTNGKLIKVIRRSPMPTYPMPLGYTLPHCKERTIEIWVNSGAPNN